MLKMLKKIFALKVLETEFNRYDFEIELNSGEKISLTMTCFTVWDFEEYLEFALIRNGVIKVEKNVYPLSSIKKFKILKKEVMNVKHYETISDIPPSLMTKEEIEERNKKYN